jgi:hypothetical protein
MNELDASSGPPQALLVPNDGVTSVAAQFAPSPRRARTFRAGGGTVSPSRTRW